MLAMLLDGAFVSHAAGSAGATFQSHLAKELAVKLVGSWEIGSLVVGKLVA